MTSGGTTNEIKDAIKEFYSAYTGTDPVVSLECTSYDADAVSTSCESVDAFACTDDNQTKLFCSSCTDTNGDAIDCADTLAVTCVHNAMPQPLDTVCNNFNTGLDGACADPDNSLLEVTCTSCTDGTNVVDCLDTSATTCNYDKVTLTPTDTACGSIALDGNDGEYKCSNPVLTCDSCKATAFTDT
jgi:hypothetical protein